MLGDSTDAVIQGIIVFALGVFLGIPLNPLTFLEALPVMILMTFGLVGIGLTVASFIDSLESFGVIQSFINLPLFFLSGALFPIRGDVPNWLQIASSFNPLTYGIDALRTIILGNAWQPLHPMYFNLLVVCCFDVVMMTIGTYAFSRRK
jgi:ABC-2 type transport system permease protein